LRALDPASIAQRGLLWVEENRWLRAPARAARRVGRDNLPTFAAAISFQFVISLIPLLAVMTVGASFFVNADSLAAQVIEITGGIAPQSESLLGTIVQSVTDLRGQVGVISFVGLLWTGSNLFTTLRRGLNVAVGARQRRRYLQSRLVDLGVAAMTGLMLAISVALTAGLSLLQQTEVLGPASPLATLGLLLRMLTVLVPVVMTTGIFALLFGLLPAQPLPRREAMLAGAIAAVLFEIGKNAFVWYVSSFANFNLVYGPLAALVVLLLWLYYCSLIVLSAAALGSEIVRPARPVMPCAHAPSESEAAR